MLHSAEMTDHVRVFCLRHAESENVLAGTAGVLPSAPLTPHGWDQAITAAEALGHESITRIFSSTAIRARDTADVIAHILGVETVTMPELLEVGIGAAEGATDATTRAQTATVLRAWIVDRELSAKVADGETGHEGPRCVVGLADVLNPRRVRGQIAWASSVNAAATRVAGGASMASS
jgi:broad specificity phosphatase PhoE